MAIASHSQTWIREVMRKYTLAHALAKWTALICSGGPTFFQALIFYVESV